MAKEADERPLDFIREIVAADNASGKYGGRVITRFPPEPSGYLHIGNAKAALVNFGIAAENGGRCNLRFDDTNPLKEEGEFVDAIEEDLRWLGCDWGEQPKHASEYFARLYEYALRLVEKGDAYVCQLSPDEIREYRGTLTEPGRNSPWRDRPREESRELLERMRAGEFTEGTHSLRAKIDMASPNIPMRDPVLYRILNATHHRTGDSWHIYPMYDFAHCLSDAIEGVTHSLCSIEFDNNRPLYDWILAQVGIEAPRPQQYEFALLRLTHTILGKRHLRRMVEEGIVSGWDDPRMPTLSGLRRRGYTPGSVRSFIDKVGLARRESTSELALLEHCLRDELNRSSPRVMGILHPLRLVIENYPEDQIDEFEAINNPEDPAAGTRRVPFSGELFVERDDFREQAPRKYHRLAPGREVRLRYAYLVTCTGFETDERGEISLVRCRYDPATRGGDAPDGRRVRGTLHWVSARHALRAEVRLYDTLFSEPEADRLEDFHGGLNPDSLVTLSDCRVEPGLAGAEPGLRLQFERQGYFCVDPDSRPGQLVFNRTVPLRDSWARLEKRNKT